MTNVIRNRRGVTLVELLAVVVILGIIAAIAIPTIGGLIERQRKNAAEASFVTIVEASRLYAVAESPTDGEFTLKDLEDKGYIANLSYTIAGTGALNTHIEIKVTGSAVVVSFIAPATGLTLNGQEMEIDGSNFTGKVKPAA